MKHLSVHLYALLLSIILTFFASGLQWFGSLQGLNDMIFDQQLKQFSQGANPDIVIVTIDDQSINNLGKWPWPRSIHAQFINQLTTVQPLAIGMDILFVDPDRYNPENDTSLAAAIQRNGKIVLPAVVEKNKFNSAAHITLPIQKIASVAHVGHVNVTPDTTGIVRGLFLNAYIKPIHIPAFSEALLNIGHPKLTTPAIITTQQLAVIKSDALPFFSQYARIPFFDAIDYYQSFSYVDVLRSEKIRRQLRGKYVLVGLNATGLGTRFATSVSSHSNLMSGIELNANVLDMLLRQKSIIPLSSIWTFLLTALLILIPTFSGCFLSNSKTLFTTISFILLSLLLSTYLLIIEHILFEPAAIILSLSLAYLFWSSKHLNFISFMLFSEKEKSQATLLAIGDPVLTTNHQSKIEFMNPAAEVMLGYSAAKAKGKHFESLFTMEDADNSSQLLSIINHDTHPKEKSSKIRYLINQAGKKYAVQWRINPIYDQYGEMTGAVYAIRDLTKLLSISQKITHIATHDSLTELPNRILLQDRLIHAINVATRTKKLIAILYIDLDGFKKINDGLGHAAGDLLLQEVAKRLRASVRQIDTTARWGGDEFVIMLENLQSETYVAEIASKIIQNLSLPVTIMNQEVFVTPSIGISLFPKDSNSADALLAQADAAMYSVKGSGRNAFSFYYQGLNDSAHERLEMEKEMRHALAQGDFEIYYQPQIDLITHQMVGVEALLRWQHREKGFILPDAFISLAEEIGLIVPIGEWLVKTVCQQLESWKKQGMPSIHVAVNVSPRQFMQKDLVNMFLQCIEKYAIGTGTLQIEVTESVMMNDIESAIKTLQALQDAGISVAIDDFGIGYSSLSYLKQLPIDKLKIDKSFVNNLLSDPDDASIVQAVIALGHKMNMQIVAEGVESHEQLLFLKEHKCNFGQGYYFDKPLQLHKLERLLLTQKMSQNQGG